MMRPWTLAVSAAAATAVAVAAPPAPAGDVAGPFPLVTLPALGSVTWTCASDAFGLAVRLHARSATTHIVLRAGGVRVRRVTLQPGEHVRFPSRRARDQRLAFIQPTGAGTLRATVRVGFTAGGPVAPCRAYAPPDVIVRVRSRR